MGGVRGSAGLSTVLCTVLDLPSSTFVHYREFRYALKPSSEVSDYMWNVSSKPENIVQ